MLRVLNFYSYGNIWCIYFYSKAKLVSNKIFPFEFLLIIIYKNQNPIKFVLAENSNFVIHAIITDASNQSINKQAKKFFFTKSWVLFKSSIPNSQPYFLKVHFFCDTLSSPIPSPHLPLSLVYRRTGL